MASRIRSRREMMPGAGGGIVSVGCRSGCAASAAAEVDATCLLNASVPVDDREPETIGARAMLEGSLAARRRVACIWNKLRLLDRRVMLYQRYLVGGKFSQR